jgi:hypothetical protein
LLLEQGKQNGDQAKHAIFLSVQSRNWKTSVKVNKFFGEFYLPYAKCLMRLNYYVSGWATPLLPKLPVTSDPGFHYYDWMCSLLCTWRCRRKSFYNFDRVFFVRCEARMKKQLSLDHIIQRSTSRRKQFNKQN